MVVNLTHLTSTCSQPWPWPWFNLIKDTLGNSQDLSLTASCILTNAKFIQVTVDDSSPVLSSMTAAKSSGSAVLVLGSYGSPDMKDVQANSVVGIWWFSPTSVTSALVSLISSLLLCHSRNTQNVSLPDVVHCFHCAVSNCFIWATETGHNSDLYSKLERTNAS